MEPSSHDVFPSARQIARGTAKPTSSSTTSSAHPYPPPLSSLDSSSSSYSESYPSTQKRNNPYLPTPTEIVLLVAYPILLMFGAMFAVLSPTVRAAPYDEATQSHIQDPSLAPSYFARKNNLFNVLFVKRGWGWITLSFFVFLFTHPAVKSPQARIKASIRWGVITAWWVFVTQWFFGPAIIDRGFRLSGGGCEDSFDVKLEQGEGVKGLVSAAACKAAGGRWSGGHDISGHVFLLVLGSAFLLQEVGWVAGRWARYVREERTVVMVDGAVKGASLEKDRKAKQHLEEESVARTTGDALGHGGRFAVLVMGMSVWMLLMTAIYFHTWFEKEYFDRGSECAQTTFNDLIEAIRSLLFFLTFLHQQPSLLLCVKPYTMTAVDGTMAPTRISVPPNLPELVKNAFNRARASGDVHFYPTQVKLLNINSIPFQLRFAPSLLSKPKSPLPPPPAPATSATASSTPLKKPFFDPFENPPPEAMLISPLPPSHNLVLNKFAIVPEHFILCTREWREQTDLLDAEDLEAAYACIRGYRDAGKQQGEGGGDKELYVFYNSGAASGSSQPHRHLQLLVAERMREGLEGQGERGSGWDVLAKKLADGEVRGRLPFKTFAERIPAAVVSGADDDGDDDDNKRVTDDGKALREVYLSLYRKACKEVLGLQGAEEDEIKGEGEAKMDYNFAMTRDVMVLMPRVQEGDEVKDGKGEVVGKLALNGTVLAGTALVKSQQEWDALREDEGQLRDILGRIGVPVTPMPMRDPVGVWVGALGIFANALFQEGYLLNEREFG
ncbi:FIT family protein scs3 [Cladorrhinum samala]|uniref:FIT family protein scs3 n=1 Tax=Cladorrhinum samala TaxID=585594 RepID=A0AAV9HTP6_9PEZI|nr:FIT family protein scs3 [Cladorrhinum samala]